MKVERVSTDTALLNQLGAVQSGHCFTFPTMTGLYIRVHDTTVRLEQDPRVGLIPVVELSRGSLSYYGPATPIQAVVPDAKVMW